MAIRTLVDLKVFHILSEQDLISAHELGRKTGADVLLLTRFLRVLVALGYVSETGIDHYGPTKWTRHFSNKSTEGMVKFMYTESCCGFCSIVADDFIAMITRCLVSLPRLSG